MQKTIELELKVGSEWSKVEIDKNTQFNWNIQHFDLQNPTTLKNNFTTTVHIPRSGVNNQIFNEIWKLDSIVSDFNPLIRTPFRLYLNGNLFHKGYVQLTDINDYYYNVTCYGELGDIYYYLNDKEINKLRNMGTWRNMSAYNHIINFQEIQNRWNEITPTKPYNYAMTYQGHYDNFDNKTVVNEKLPNDPDLPDGERRLSNVTWYNRKKHYIDTDMTEHERTTFDYSVVLDREIPVWGEYRSYYQRPMLRIKDIFEGIVERLEMDGWNVNLDNEFFNEKNPYWEKLWMICPQYNLQAVDQVNPSQPITVSANGTSNTIYGDKDGYVSGATTSYTLPSINIPDKSKDYEVEIDMPMMLEAIYTSGGPWSTWGLTKSKPVTVNAFLEIDFKNGNTKRIPLLIDEQPNFTGNSANLQIQRIIYSNFTYQKRGATYDSDLAKNFQVTGKGVIRKTDFGTSNPSCRVIVYVNGSLWWGTVDGGHKNKTGFRVKVNNSRALYSFSNIGGSLRRSGSEKTFEDMIQQDVTNYDFLTSYLKIFDLRMKIDNNERNLDILLRSNYFNPHDKLDWTKKIDYSKDIITTPIPFDYRYGSYSFKEGDTLLEKDYKNKYGIKYGEKRFDNGMEFSDVEYELLGENIFTNTVVMDGYSKYYLDRTPVMYKDNKCLPNMENNGVSNFNLVFYDGLRELENPTGFEGSFLVSDDTETMLTDGYAWSSIDNDFITGANPVQVMMNHYPRLVKYVNANDDTYYLEFDVPNALYNAEENEMVKSTENIADKTIYSRFWKDYIHDRFSKNSKLLTCYVNLSNEDMEDDILTKFIYIDNTVWVINKIYQYNPLSDAPTKVELISVQDVKNYISVNLLPPKFTLKNVTSNEYWYDSDGILAPDSDVLKDLPWNPSQITFEIDSEKPWEIKRGPRITFSQQSGFEGKTLITCDIEPNNNTVVHRVAYFQVLYGGQSFWVQLTLGLHPEYDNDSYVILTDNTRIDFSSSNTPISNLSTDGNSTSSITINGQSVVKDTIKEVYFGDSYNEVTSIPTGFLSYSSNLENVNLSGLKNVTSIGGLFISYCLKLTSLDLSPLSKVNSIDTYFIMECPNLNYINIGDWNVTDVTIGVDNFYGVPNVSTSIVYANDCNYSEAFINKFDNISNWEGKCPDMDGDSYWVHLDGTIHYFGINNTPINNFTRGVAEQQIIIINGQSVVKDTIQEVYFGDSYNEVIGIGNWFLDDCTNLTSINLNGLKNVTSIGGWFLSGCLELTSIDLSPLSNVTSLEIHFLGNCKSLTSIDLSPLSNVTTIGEHGSFLSGCSGLTSIDLSPLSKLTHLMNYFLSGCSSLTYIDLSPLSNVTSIGLSFLQDCSSLISVNLSGLNKLTHIPYRFLRNCSSLTSIDLSPLGNVTTISRDFLRNCSSLTSIDLSPFSKVTEIDSYFLNDCTSLTFINFSGLKNDIKIWIYFINYCTSLSEINIGNWVPNEVGGKHAFLEVENVSSSIIWADTITLGDTFKTKFPNINKWTVLTNP